MAYYRLIRGRRLLCFLCIQEGIDGEFQEKKADLQPKVVEIYESAPAPLKVRTLVLCYYTVHLRHTYGISYCVRTRVRSVI